MRSRDSSDTLRQRMLSVSLGAAELITHTHTHTGRQTHTHVHRRCDVVCCDFVSDWAYIWGV